MRTKPATGAELRRAGERAKRAVRRAVLYEDFRALDRIIFEGWTAAQFACRVFGRLVEKEEVRGGPLFHPLMNRWRLLSVIQGLPDPLADLPSSPQRPN